MRGGGGATRRAACGEGVLSAAGDMAPLLLPLSVRLGSRPRRGSCLPCGGVVSLRAPRRDGPGRHTQRIRHAHPPHAPHRGARSPESTQVPTGKGSHLTAQRTRVFPFTCCEVPLGSGERRKTAWMATCRLLAPGRGFITPAAKRPPQPLTPGASAGSPSTGAPPGPGCGFPLQAAWPVSRPARGLNGSVISPPVALSAGQASHVSARLRPSPGV